MRKTQYCCLEMLLLKNKVEKCDFLTFSCRRPLPERQSAVAYVPATHFNTWICKLATAGKAICSGLRWNSVFWTQKQFLNSNSKTGAQDPPAHVSIVLRLFSQNFIVYNQMVQIYHLVHNTSPWHEFTTEFFFSAWTFHLLSGCTWENTAFILTGWWLDDVSSNLNERQPTVYYLLF